LGDAVAALLAVPAACAPGSMVSTLVAKLLSWSVN
jgi:hypothetical protein